MRTGLSFIGMVLYVGMAGADTKPWMSAADIQKALAGKTLEGRYASGRPFVESYKADGRVEYLESGRKIGGHWSVTAGALCTIYDSDPTGGCFKVSRTGANCFEFYFVTRTEEQAVDAGEISPHWTAEGAIAGEATACKGGASV